MGHLWEEECTTSRRTSNDSEPFTFSAEKRNKVTSGVVSGEVTSTCDTLPDPVLPTGGAKEGVAESAPCRLVAASGLASQHCFVQGFAASAGFLLPLCATFLTFLSCFSLSILSFLSPVISFFCFCLCPNPFEALPSSIPRHLSYLQAVGPSNSWGSHFHCCFLYTGKKKL